MIFLDVRLGTDNGLEYIPQLLADSPWARLIVITAYASIDTAVEAMKLGATDYLPKPFEHKQLLLLTRKVAERQQLERRIISLQRALGAMDPEWDLPTSNPVWREQLELARRIAETNVAVLISGEPGSGRGRLGRAIHEWSHRAAGPFVSLSMRAESHDELEAELFGSEGAVGAVPASHGGTLMLEDLAELPVRLQPRVLALLRDKEFERADTGQRRPIDVRLIALVDPSLEDAVEAGRFRADLLAALNVVRIDVPPLRHRHEDVPLLAERYLAHFARQHRRSIAGFTRDAAYVLRSHDWPGNARELRNVVERAVLVCTADLVDLKHLPADLVNAAGAREAGNHSTGYAIGDLVPLALVEEMHIRRVLEVAGTTRRAAAILGINASTIFRRLRRLEPDNDVSDHDPPQ
jgi:NtrC-family two-component system response regulator AlgB